MIIDADYPKDTYLLADGTVISGEELYIMQRDNKTKYEDELFSWFRQVVGQEIFDFICFSERYKKVKVDFENVGPMGGRSVNISGWATDNSGNAVIPFTLNVYCDSVVYERMKQDLLEAQEFAKSQEDIKKFLLDE